MLVACPRPEAKTERLTAPGHGQSIAGSTHVRQWGCDACYVSGKPGGRTLYIIAPTAATATTIDDATTKLGAGNNAQVMAGYVSGCTPTPGGVASPTLNDLVIGTEIIFESGPPPPKFGGTNAECNASDQTSLCQDPAPKGAFSSWDGITFYQDNTATSSTDYVFIPCATFQTNKVDTFQKASDLGAKGQAVLFSGSHTMDGGKPSYKVIVPQ
jgi:hypothetical protein